jgi:hypothetical protein
VVIIVLAGGRWGALGRWNHFQRQQKRIGFFTIGFHYLDLHPFNPQGNHPEAKSQEKESFCLDVPSGQIGSARECYHWIGLEKDINRYMFLIF